MRRTARMLAIVCPVLFALHLQAQTETFSFHKRNCTVIEVLDSVRSQLGIHRINAYSLLENAKRISVLFVDVPIDKVLEVCSRNQYFTLVLKDGLIRVKPRTINYHGVIVNDHDAPVDGAVIYMDGKKVAASNNNGEFDLVNVFANAKIKITAVNIVEAEMYLEGKTSRQIHVKQKVRSLSGISVLGNTGYQNIHKRHSPTGFFVISNAALSQQGANTFSERIKGISLGVSPTVNKVPGVNQPSLHAVSPRTTILAGSDPLYVLDNLPFWGNVNDLNLDDIENITIHKDASATSVWGTKTGNGVIVINTKSGKYDQPREIAINTSLTIGQEPDVFYYPVMDPDDRMDLTRELFKNGYYSMLEHSRILALPTAVEKLILNRKGLLSNAELDAQLEGLKYDKRDDLRKYIYRKNIERHFSVRVSGGTADHSYNLSLGYDKNDPNILGSWSTKKSLLLNHSYNLNNWLEITSGVIYLENQLHNTDGIPESREPMVNANGEPASQPRVWRQAYIDTAGAKKLLDWNYRPLEDFGLRDINNKVTNLLMRSSWRAQIVKGLHFNVLYQFQEINGEVKQIKDAKSYYVRDLINSFTQRKTTGMERPIPEGHILDEVNSEKLVNNIRVQLLGQKKLGDSHMLKLQAGVEKIKVTENVSPVLIYGYQPGMPNVQSNLNFTDFFSHYITSSPLKIPTAAASSYAKANYLSFFAIGNYDYSSTINFVASARMDKTELFPEIVSSDFITLFSSGIGWKISKSRFYNVDWLPYLKVRLSYGANGNAPITTLVAPLNQSVTRITGSAQADLPRPRWEKVNTLSAGFDMGTNNNRIEACLDVYQKKSKDLIGLRHLQPNQPHSLVTDNIGEMKAYGVDVVFSSVNVSIPDKFRWATKLLFSYVYDKVTRYADTTTMPGWLLCEQNYQGIAVGKPLYGVFSYPYAGLKPETGDPQGYLGGQVSKDYYAILNAPGMKELRYHGRSTPAVFGSFINQFSLGAFSLSVILSYKLGYYFRRTSVNYDQFLNNLSDASPDFKDRWQKEGDELTTNTPSSVDIFQPDRDAFFSYNEMLVEKGDHLRLQAINTSVGLPVQKLKKYYLQSCSLYCNVTNLGILWRANQRGIDPDNITGFPEPRSVCVGVRINFR